MAPAHQVIRFYEDIWNRRDFTAIPEVLAPSLTFRGSLGSVRTGHDEFTSYVEEVTAALGDYRCDIETLVAEDRRVAARLLFSGIHRGPFMGYHPTGERVAWAGAAFFTFVGVLIDDVWVLGDLHGLHEQLRNQARPARP
jgi:predicted ester cyclase